MRHSLKFLVIALGLPLIAACSRVGNGEVGVRYHTLSSDRGVEQTPLGMGWYLTGPGTGIETFPTFAQTRTWTYQNNEALAFADNEGLPVTAEMGITYQVDPQKAPYLYSRYRRGIDEITDTFVHNIVRSVLIEQASHMPVSDIYGAGRTKLLNSVQTELQRQLAPQGIEVQNMYWVGELGLPDSVKESIKMKVQAVQKAQQIENEVAQSQAEAQKAVAVAEGAAKARLTQANAEAEANKEIAQSISPTLVEYMKVKAWNGQLPKVSGGSQIISLSEGGLK